MELMLSVKRYYILSYTFKKVFTTHNEVYSDVSSNCGRLMQSNCHWWPFKTVKFQIHEGFPYFFK